MRGSYLIAIYLPGWAIAYSRVLSQTSLVVRNDTLPGILTSEDDFSSLQRRSPIPGSPKSGEKRKNGGTDSVSNTPGAPTKKQRANPPSASRQPGGAITRSQTQGEVAEGATQAKGNEAPQVKGKEAAQAKGKEAVQTKGKQAAQAKGKEKSQRTAQTVGKGTARGRARAELPDSSDYNNPANLDQNIRKQHPTLGKRPYYGGMSPISSGEMSTGSPASPARHERSLPRRPPFSHDTILTSAGSAVAGFGKLTGPGYLRTKGSEQSPKVTVVPPGETISKSIYDPRHVSVQAEMLEHHKYPSTGREMRVETTGMKASYMVQPGFFPEVNRQTGFMSENQKIVGKLDGTPGRKQRWLFPDFPNGQHYDHGAELKGATGTITGSAYANKDIGTRSKISEWKPLHQLQQVHQQQEQQQYRGSPLEWTSSRRFASSQQPALLNQLPPGPSLHRGSSQQFAQFASEPRTASRLAQMNPHLLRQWDSSPQHNLAQYRESPQRHSSNLPELQQPLPDQWLNPDLLRQDLTPSQLFPSQIQPAVTQRLDLLQHFNLQQQLNVPQPLNTPQQFNTPQQSSTPQQFGLSLGHQWTRQGSSPMRPTRRETSPGVRDNPESDGSKRRG